MPPRKKANGAGTTVLGGEFYTPADVVRALVEVLEPDYGRVYDPCCGSGGMFVQTKVCTELRFCIVRRGQVSTLVTGAVQPTLACLRDFLLPQLMSGKLRVKDAEKVVEGAI